MLPELPFHLCPFGAMTPDAAAMLIGTHGAQDRIGTSNPFHCDESKRKFYFEIEISTSRS